MKLAESHPSRIRTRAIWALLVAAGLSVVTLASLRDAAAPAVTRRAPRQGPARATPAPEAAAKTASGPVEFGLVVGDALTYLIESSDTVEIHMPQQDTTRKGMRLLGSMTLRVYEARERSWIVGIRAADVRLTPGPSPEPGVHAKAGPVVNLGEVLVEIRRSGRLGRIVFFDDESARTRRLWKAILARWQVVLPEASGDVSWTTRESDPTGGYLASYRRISGPTPAKLLKRKVRYLDSDLVVTGETRITLDTCLRTLEGNEETRAGLDGGGQAISESRFRFVRIAYARQELEDDGRRACFARSAGTTLDDPDPVQPKAREAVSGDVVREHLRGLRQVLDQGKSGTVEEHRALVAVLRDLRASDAALDTVRARLGEASCDDAETSLLIAALAATGTEGAQEAIRGILADPASSPVRQRAALFAVAQIEEPVAVLDPELRRLRDAGGELADSALLVFASVGGRVRSTDPARHDAIRTEVEALLDRAESVQELNLALYAMGNVGAGKIPRGVQSALTHDVAPLRAAAAEAMRRIDRVEADLKLRELVRQDPSPHVRQKALDVLLRRGRDCRQLSERELVELVAETARTDPDEDVRAYAAEQLKRA